MKKKKISEKKEAKQRASTRQLIGAKAVTDYSLVTYGQGTGLFHCEAIQHLCAFRSEYRRKDLCADDCIERRGGDRDAVFKQQGEL